MLGALVAASLVPAASAQDAPAPAATAAPQAPAAAPAAPASAAPAASGQPAAPPAVVPRPMSEQPQALRNAGRRAPRRRAEKPRGPVTGPVATFPGFKVLPDGTSRVFVEVSKKVDITEHKAQGRVTYRMKGVSAPIRTNRLPLLTGFFASPVGRVQLVEEGSDVDLVIELRAPSEAQHKVIASEGGIVLQVDFPKAAGAIGPAPAAVSTPATPDRAKRGTDTTTIQGGGGY